MNERHRAIDFRVIVENAGPVHFLGDEFRNRGRAIHRRQDADIVPGAGLPVGSQITLERRTQLGWQDFVVLCALGKTVVACEIAQRHILLVHPITGRDRL